MLLPFALVIIPVAAKSLQSNLLKCENTNYYRTRFHPEYYKDSLSQFHKVTEGMKVLQIYNPKRLRLVPTRPKFGI